MDDKITKILELIKDYKTEKHSRKCRTLLGIIARELKNLCKETEGEKENETSWTETNNGRENTD